MDFFWLIPQQLAGGSLPREPTDMVQLHGKKIRHVISLILDSSKVQDLKANYDIDLHHIPIKDWGIPSQTQIQQFISIVSENIANNQASFVHCAGGCGRTGTMLALYMVHLGYVGKEVIERVRTVRPCSVETEEQEQLVLNFTPAREK